MESDVSKLIIRAQKGDKDAFGQVYTLFFRKIFRFAYYSVFNRQLAEDITQDTFLRAWKSLPGFSSQKGTFQAFLFTIARNLVIDHVRRKREVSLEVVGEIVSGEDPESEVITEGERQMIHKSLATLESFEKDLIILRYFEELSYAEIADITGKNAQALRVRVHRALKKLKNYLKGEVKEHAT